jgi:alanine dehydrogenase
MLIGVPKEIKDNENRVGLTPAAVSTLTQHGHHVLLQTQAGAGSFLTDAEYEAAGATIVETAQQAWAAQMVVKVKEPIAEEYPFFREDLLLFAFGIKSGFNRSTVKQLYDKCCL